MYSTNKHYTVLVASLLLPLTFTSVKAENLANKPVTPTSYLNQQLTTIQGSEVADFAVASKSYSLGNKTSPQADNQPQPTTAPEQPSQPSQDAKPQLQEPAAPTPEPEKDTSEEQTAPVAQPAPLDEVEKAPAVATPALVSHNLTLSKYVYKVASTPVLVNQQVTEKVQEVEKTTKELLSSLGDKLDKAKQDLITNLDQEYQKAQDLADKARVKAQELANNASKLTGQAAEKAKELADKLAQEAQGLEQLAQEAKAKVKQALDQANQDANAPTSAPEPTVAPVVVNHDVTLAKFVYPTVSQEQKPSEATSQVEANSSVDNTTQSVAQETNNQSSSETTNNPVVEPAPNSTTDSTNQPTVAELPSVPSVQAEGTKEQPNPAPIAQDPVPVSQAPEPVATNPFVATPATVPQIADLPPVPEVEAEGVNTPKDASLVAKAEQATQAFKEYQASGKLPASLDQHSVDQAKAYAQEARAVAELAKKAYVNAKAVVDNLEQQVQTATGEAKAKLEAQVKDARLRLSFLADDALQAEAKANETLSAFNVRLQELVASQQPEEQVKTLVAQSLSLGHNLTLGKFVFPVSTASSLPANQESNEQATESKETTTSTDSQQEATKPETDKPEEQVTESSSKESSTENQVDSQQEELDAKAQRESDIAQGKTVEDSQTVTNEELSPEKKAQAEAEKAQNGFSELELATQKAKEKAAKLEANKHNLTKSSEQVKELSVEEKALIPAKPGEGLLYKSIYTITPENPGKNLTFKTKYLVVKEVVVDRPRVTIQDLKKPAMPTEGINVEESVQAVNQAQVNAAGKILPNSVPSNTQLQSSQEVNIPAQEPVRAPDPSTVVPTKAEPTSPVPAVPQEATPTTNDQPASHPAVPLAPAEQQPSEQPAEQPAQDVPQEQPTEPAQPVDNNAQPMTTSDQHASQDASQLAKDSQDTNANKTNSSKTGKYLTLDKYYYVVTFKEQATAPVEATKEAQTTPNQADQLPELDTNANPFLAPPRVKPRNLTLDKWSLASR